MQRPDTYLRIPNLSLRLGHLLILLLLAVVRNSIRTYVTSVGVYKGLALEPV